MPCLALTAVHTHLSIRRREHLEQSWFDIWLFQMAPCGCGFKYYCGYKSLFLFIMKAVPRHWGTLGKYHEGEGRGNQASHAAQRGGPHHRSRGVASTPFPPIVPHGDQASSLPLTPPSTWSDREVGVGQSCVSSSVKQRGHPYPQGAAGGSGRPVPPCLPCPSVLTPQNLSCQQQ